MPITVLAASSAGYDVNQERTGPIEISATSTNYDFKGEVGHPGVGISTSTNYVYQHGTIWLASTTATPPVPPPGSGVVGGPGGFFNVVNPTTVFIVQIDEDSVLIIWITTQPSTSRVAYGTQSSVDLGLRPNYGYQFSTPEFQTNDTYHAVIIEGLTAGQLYYFRAISKANGTESISRELLMAPVFATKIVTEEGEIICTEPVCPSHPQTPPVTCPAPVPVPPLVRPSRNGPVAVVPLSSPAPSQTLAFSSSPAPSLMSATASVPPAEVLAAGGQPEVIRQIRREIPGSYGATILGFLLLIVAQAVNSIRLGRMADKFKCAEKSDKIGKAMRNSVYLSVLFITLAIATVFAIDGGNIFRNTADAILPQNMAIIRVSAKGAIKDILGRPVSGLTILADGTTVVTSDNGLYAMDNIDKEAGLNLIHPRLTKTINKEIEPGGSMDILFDLDVMEAMLSAVEQDGLVRNDQTVYVGKIRKVENFTSSTSKQSFPQVVHIEVFTLQGIVNYIFTLEQGNWKRVF